MTDSCSDSSCSASVSGWEGEEAGCEIEAAEALASLAKSATAVIDRKESSVDEEESVESWRSKGKRRGTNKRARDDSSLVDSRLMNSVNVKSVPMDFDLNEDQLEPCEQESGNVGLNANEGAEPKIEAQGNSDQLPAEGDLACSSKSYGGTFGGKSRHSLTEAEKEARRLRRVLANRESARQTIRRRQALYEELNRKAASLALENESLKRDRETAFKEYQSLQLTNKNLIDQMEMILGPPPPKVESRQGMAILNNASPSLVPSQKSYPFCFCNNETTLMAPYVWPSGIQFSNLTPAQLVQYGITAISPSLMTPGSDSHQVSNCSINIQNNTTRPPFCIMPCPLVYSVPHHNVTSCSPHPVSSILVNDNQQTTQNFVDHDNCATASASTSSKALSSLENHLCFSTTVDFKTEAPTAEANNIPQMPIASSLSRPSECQPNSTRLVYKPAAQMCCGHSSTGSVVKDVSEHQASGVASEEVVVPAAGVGGQIPTVILQEKKGAGIVNNPAGKNTVDSSATAAEARKRRKELTNMKNLHCRPHKKPFFG